MPSLEIIAEASKPTFYSRVAYIALKVAQNVASEDPGAANHANRVAYSSRIFAGQDNAVLLAQHVVSSNPTIAATMEADGSDAVPDGDIEFALASIWDARANAFATGA